MPNSVRALDAVGPRPRRAGAGHADGRGRVARPPRPPAARVDQAAITRRAGAPLVVVDRTWLHRLLATALPEGAVHTGAAVEAVHDDGCRARLGLVGTVDER
jgi:hypothetical protein